MRGMAFWTSSRTLRIMAGVAVALGLLPGRTAPADEVTKWNEVGAIAAVTNAGRPPAAATLDLAYVHIAMYDAVSAIDGRYRPFAVRVHAPSQASLEAAAAAAAHRVLVTFFPAQFVSLDGQYAASLTGIPDGDSKEQGIAVGEEVAVRLLEQRARNGRDAAIPYLVGSGPGVYQLTPPAFAPPQVPWAAAMTPLAIGVNWRFRAEPPPPLRGDRWARDYQEVKRLGTATGSDRIRSRPRSASSTPSTRPSSTPASSATSRTRKTSRCPTTPDSWLGSTWPARTPSSAAGTPSSLTTSGDR